MTGKNCQLCRKHISCHTCGHGLLPYSECLNCHTYLCMPCTNKILEDMQVFCPCELPTNTTYTPYRHPRIQKYLSAKIFKYFGEKINSLKSFLKIGEKNV